MLVCAGGASTSILMKKMEKWAADNGVDLEVKAYGVSAYEEAWKGYDVILTGPQIAYKVKEITSKVSIPVAQMAPMDYALGNAENIMKQVQSLLK
ncbi:MAG: PTS sugar transporter subunit IIB [Erysipelotrichaceae bacterium]|jgi:PTS system cellobiose-specific IIB component|nr:PTS sugar transporter subunit IIB [Erysipelotrichaceae bacterium]